ncbi:MAG: ABC transporter substrate-binding protein [Candidatus Hydrogenedentes bacterium]|nr:ABC transporter substrate-binding protein [Candidatus Hydrogenedentota bacterium]
MMRSLSLLTLSVAALALVLAGFFFLTQVVARLTWMLADAGTSAPAGAPEAALAPVWTPPKATAVHHVEEWPAERGRVFHEAPMLHALTTPGSLASVSDRLPFDPLVIVPPEQCGRYGGAWNRLASSPGDIANQLNRIFYEGLLRYGALGDSVLPNLASRWSVDDDGRAFTFWLRKGVRWSDGVPFTTDDIRFWYDDILHNADLTPTLPSYFMRGGVLMSLEVVDEYTFRFRFKEPYGLFIPLMAARYSDAILYPAHYLKQYHPKYAPKEKLEELAREDRLDLWFQLFARKQDWTNPDLPRLTAWIMKRPPPARPIVLERNPYYWRVDPAGNQLPYLDRIDLSIYDVETINLKTINGEADMQDRHLAFNNFPLFMENRARGGYTVRQWIDGGDMMNAILINLNHRDPILRDIFRDFRFRKAMSLAINRQELNKACYFGIGKPRQLCPPQASPFYSADYEAAYTQFDPDEANRLLDEMGLDRRAKNGTRLRPDGKPLKLTIEISSAMLYPLLIQLVAEYWTNAGVETEMKMLARELVNRRMDATLHDVTVWTGAGEYQPLLDPRYFFPHNVGSYYGLDFMRWYTSGAARGEKPLPDMLRCIDLYRKIEAATDEQEQRGLFKEIIEINRQNLWVIGLIGELPSLCVVKEGFRNVPDVAVSSFVFRTPGNMAPECFFRREN